jgi:hypothetical protein
MLEDNKLSTVKMALEVMKIHDSRKYDAFVIKLKDALNIITYNAIDRDEEIVSFMAEDELFVRCVIIVLTSSNFITDDYHAMLKEISNEQ